MTFSDERSRVRPSLAEGEVRGRPAVGPSRICQLRLARLPLPVAQLDPAGPPARLEDLRRSSSSVEVEDPGMVEAGADLDVEGHPRTNRIAMMRRWTRPCPTPSSSTTTACCSTPSRSGPGPSGTCSSGAGIEFTPAAQAGAGRHLGRDRRRDPRTAARRARAGGGADRGAERAGRRRARARGGGDGRRARAAAPAEAAGDADRPRLQLAAALRPALAGDRRLRGPLRRRAQRPRSGGAEAGARSLPGGLPAAGRRGRARRSSPWRTRRPGWPPLGPPG